MEVKTEFQTRRPLSRAVRLRECPLRELRLYIYLHLQITATANGKCTDRFSASSAAAAMASGLIALAVEAK